MFPPEENVSNMEKVWSKRVWSLTHLSLAGGPPPDFITFWSKIFGPKSYQFATMKKCISFLDAKIS